MSIRDIFKQRRVTPLQRLIIDRSDNKSVSAASKKLLELAAFLIPIKPRMSKSYVERFYNDRTIIEFAIFFYLHFELHLIAILDENFRANADKIKKDYIDVFSKIQPSINFEELIKDRLILYHKKCAGARHFFDETIKTFCLLVFETQDQKKFLLHTDDFIMLSLNPIDNILFEKQVKDYLRSLDKVGKLGFVKPEQKAKAMKKTDMISGTRKVRDNSREMLKRSAHFLVFILGTCVGTWLVLAICVLLPLLGFLLIYDWGDFWFLFVGGILMGTYYLVVFALLSWYYDFVGKRKPDYWFSNIFLVIVAVAFFYSFITSFGRNFDESPVAFVNFKGIVFWISVLPAYIKVLFASLIGPFGSKMEG